MRKAISIGITLSTLLLMAFIACGSNSSTSDSKEPIADGNIDDQQPAAAGSIDDQEPIADDSPVDISGVFFTNLDAHCATYANAYFSAVRDVQSGSSFAGDLTITVVGDKCIFATNAIPNHDFNDGGHFATPISAQSARYEIPTTPTAAAEVTQLVMGDDAVFLNGGRPTNPSRASRRPAASPAPRPPMPPSKNTPPPACAVS